MAEGLAVKAATVAIMAFFVGLVAGALAQAYRQDRPGAVSAAWASGRRCHCGDYAPWNEDGAPRCSTHMPGISMLTLARYLDLARDEEFVASPYAPGATFLDREDALAARREER